jgi:hypothetical protein
MPTHQSEALEGQETSREKPRVERTACWTGDAKAESKGVSEEGLNLREDEPFIQLDGDRREPEYLMGGRKGNTVEGSWNQIAGTARVEIL